MMASFKRTIWKSAADYLFRLNHGLPSRKRMARALRADGDELTAVMEPAPGHENRVGIHLVLFFLTLATTTWAGGNSGETLLEYLVSGLPYSLTLLTILLCNEFGHYFAARKYGVAATLPYFIPFPSLIGTMGAVIKTKSPIPHRRALLYIGAMGPLAGFVPSLAAAIYGIGLSTVTTLPPPGGDMPVLVFGDSLLFKFIVTAIHGPLPPGHDVFLSPYAWAGWIGFLITGLNLMPIGQLDGGHVLYALLGRAQRFPGWLALAALVGLSLVWYGWLVWVALTLLVLMVAHPYITRGDDLAPGERAMGWLCMVIFVLTFVPVPVRIL